MTDKVAGPDGSELSEGLGAACEPLPYWVPVGAGLPPLDVPVWMWLPGETVTQRRILLGCRSDMGDDGWLWCRLWGSPWWDGAQWKADDAEADDEYRVSAWMMLPAAPNVLVTGAPS